MEEVTLLQMLDARERRAERQTQLLRQFGRPLVCFTMNIAGPVKYTPLISRSFREGCAALETRLPPSSTGSLRKQSPVVRPCMW